MKAFRFKSTLPKKKTGLAFGIGLKHFILFQLLQSIERDVREPFLMSTHQGSRDH